MMCEKCGRKLKDAVSIERGYGPVCWKRIHRAAYSVGSKKSKSEPEISENMDIPGQMCFEDFPGIVPEEQEGKT